MDSLGDNVDFYLPKTFVLDLRFLILILTLNFYIIILFLFYLLFVFRSLLPYLMFSCVCCHPCSLEFWFYMFLIVLAGNLRNAQVAVAAISIWLVPDGR